YDFIFIDIADLDLTDFSATTLFLNQTNPEIILNCAAYTAVDKAEQEPELTMKLNAALPGLLAAYCAEKKAGLIHISTDYVFDGVHHKPYLEEDPANPQGVYSRSKRMGEEEILKHPARGIIIRTSWLYSEFGNNFVKTIYNKAKISSQLRVVCDQVGTPTYAHDLAKTILDILGTLYTNQKMEFFHYSNEGVISWYDFAKAILEIADINTCEVIPIESSDYPTPVKRPFYSVLNKTKIKNRFGITIPYWKDSLKICMIRMGNGER
ncbi:MAG TPA: dTDP-4-dehydrorhamnose reductase, partial [Bacteroidales bacterium]|nr:dTDP-4-dehydrorhamnose reductase [Bacteroidales bacterium]